MLRWLTDARRGGLITALVLAAGYVVTPLVVYAAVGGDDFLRVAGLSALASACVWGASRLPLADWVLASRYPRVVVRQELFLAVVWASFGAFVVLVWATAEAVPLVAAVQGADPDTLAVLRERFLKAREGWQASFVYVNALFAGALVPYCLGLMFWRGVRSRFVAFAFFFVYCVSFLEKAFFFKAAFPLLYLALQGRGRARVRPSVAVGGLVAVLIGVSLLSGDAGRVQDGGDFFSTGFAGQGAVARLVWRSVAIPLVTAADALRVFREDFGGRPLLGATSSAVAAVLGRPRVEFERLVFFAQWGQNETGTGSSNSVYVTEAFVNFGVLGVVAFSWVIGTVLRLFAVSRDEALRAVWPLFSVAVYTGGLIGVLLSNGFVPLILLALFVRVRPAARRAGAVAPVPAPGSRPGLIPTAPAPT